MLRRHTAVLVLGLAASLTTLTACVGTGGGNPAGGSGSEEPSQLSKDVSGAMSGWGFNNADDVGKARLAYAKSQLNGVDITLDQTASMHRSSPPAR